VLIGAFVAAPSLDDRDHPARGGGGGEVGAFRSVVVVGEGDWELHLGCGGSGRGFVATARIQILFSARLGYQWPGILASQQRMGDLCKVRARCSGGPSGVSMISGVIVAGIVVNKAEGTNGRGFLQRSNKWVTCASACKVFDCLVPGMHGRSGGPSGVSMISGVIVAGVVVKAESNNKNQFFFSRGRDK
jgi:hypothetical protein